MSKEVKNQPVGKNFYLFIVQKLEEGSYPSKIAEELGITKQKLNYYLSSLKKAGAIKKVGYGVWETSKKINLEEVKKSTRVASNNPSSFYLLKQDTVRGHAFQFKLQLPDNLRNWGKREEILTGQNIKFKPISLFGGGQSLDFKGRKVHLTNKSIIFYEKESFIAELARESQSKAISHFLGLVKSLERHLSANFSFYGKYRFRVTRQHYALIKNALAKQYGEQGEKLEVYNDKGLWFLIDNSFNLNEAETVHPKTAVNDNEKVQNFFNSLKVNPLTTNEISSNFAETDERLKKLSSQSLQITQVMEQLQGNVVQIIKTFGRKE